jgi:hypothetical protein
VGFDRVAVLCARLDRDPETWTVLDEGGMTSAQWDALVDAVRAGAAIEVLVPLLDAVEDAAAAAGVDGVTTTVRQYEPLPGSTAGVRAVRGWRCPHTKPCGRVEPDRGHQPPTCALTADPLTPVRVVSG